MLSGSIRAEGRPEVQARLVANVDAVAAGDSLYLGVELVMAEGWHTYWQFAGDAGIPTEVAWTLPDRFEAGGLLWPVPSKYEEAGDLVVYGYADSLLLMSKVSVPHDLQAAEEIVVGAEVTSTSTSCAIGLNVFEITLAVPGGEEVCTGGVNGRCEWAV